MSSLSLVIALLLLGSLMLNGLQQQLSARFIHIAQEKSAIHAFSVALSIQGWATQQPWQATVAWQCQPFPVESGEACIKKGAQQEVILAARAGGNEETLTLWRLAMQQGNQLIWQAHGWSDFCPLQEESQCQLPG